MATTHRVVVDGSNLATEGRSVPSLAQLDDAVRAYAAEDPSAEIVVVVDASFGHRIDPSERAQLEEAEQHGEVVAPPAGAIGRGDAFILRIAERTGAVVLSNDSFQEFHEEHPWLFEEGRLVGGKPVPGVGWIFTPRRPVRGRRSPKKSAKAAEAGPEEPAPPEEPEEDELSAANKAAEVAKALQRAERAARRKAEAAAKAAAPGPEEASGTGAQPAGGTTPAPLAPSPTRAKRARKRSATAKATGRPADPGLRAAIDQATEEALGSVPPAEADTPVGGARRRRRKAPPPAVNEPLAFITFVAAHPLGSSVEGVVASYTSHGAMVDVPIDGGGVLHCYVPLTGLGSPPPRAAREVLGRGQKRSFVLVALDPPRRMAELALPELAGLLTSAPGDGPPAMVPRR